MPPAISILLSVYNGATTIRRCLNSIAQQTYRDWEIICVDDASDDSTLHLVKVWQEKHAHTQMKLVQNRTNLGLTASLAAGSKEAAGEFIARIDADDWWVPQKLAKQLAYLNSHPACGVVGCRYINVHGQKQTTIRLPETTEAIRQNIFRRNPFGHSCVLIRKAVFDTAGGYDTSIRYGQDRDLWFRLLPITDMANLPEALCYRTVNASSTTHEKWQIIQQLKTVHKYIRAYRASPVAYLGFVEPLILLAVPKSARIRLRKIHDRFLAH